MTQAPKLTRERQALKRLQDKNDDLTIKPDIKDYPLDFAGDVWLHPLTGERVRKDVAANLKQRQRLLEEAANNYDMQRHLLGLCQESCIYWVNLFAWTYSKKLVDDAGNESRNPEPDQPFVTWPVQDAFIDELCNAIRDGNDLLIDKSRDMGATWVILAVFTWHWLFREGHEFLLMSRKEELVDKGGDSNINTLFGKMLYMLSMLPGWMLPEYDRKKNELVNKSTGCVLDGESTNASAGRSQRYDAAMVDEFAEIENGEVIADGLSDTTVCRIFNSTPKGPETAHSKLRRSGTVPIFILHWVNHPDKGRGRKVIKDPVTHKKKWSSPWYKKQCERRKASPQDIAINLDINHLGAGVNFFDLEHLFQRRADHERPALFEGRLHFADGVGQVHMVEQLRRRMSESIWFEEAPHDPDAELRLWDELEVDHQRDRLRPQQGRVYCIGCDISTGNGSSNTVFSIGYRDGPMRNVKVAEWKSSRVLPQEAARAAVALGLWFGGLGKYPLIAFERNGPGETFAAEMKDLMYPRVFHDKTVDRREDQDTGGFGWRSSNVKKLMLFEALRAAYACNRFENPSKQSYDEAEMYVWTKTGGIQPSATASDGRARATHGDVVVADGLLLMALDRAEGYGIPREAADPETMAGRFEMRQDEARQREKWARSPAQRRYLMNGGG